MNLPVVCRVQLGEKGILVHHVEILAVCSDTTCANCLRFCFLMLKNKMIVNRASVLGYCKRGLDTVPVIDLPEMSSVLVNNISIRAFLRRQGGG